MLLIFAIKDEKTGGFLKPFSSLHNEEVIRSLKSSISNARPGDTIAEFPEDYSLWVVAQFDQSNGKIEPHYYHVMNVIDIKNSLMKGVPNVA